MSRVLSVDEIKRILIRYHQEKGFKIFKSFPLMSGDPTVMFTNATITPFKRWFTDVESKPENYAFIQKCFRMGRKDEIEFVGRNPYYFTFFEMFGSGIFTSNYSVAVRYLLDLLEILDLEAERTFFTVPTGEFGEVLLANRVDSSRIFSLKKNDHFWQEWRFGKLGAVGKGVTVIYSHSHGKVTSIQQMIDGQDRFIELLNLIYLYGQETGYDGIVPIANPGFDLGVGVERLAAAIQGCNGYEIDTLKPLTNIVGNFIGFSNIEDVRIISDHLRAILILAEEGVSPSNKREGYVMRKLIRRFLEITWIAVQKTIRVDGLINDFGQQMLRDGTITRETAIKDLVNREAYALREIMRRAVTTLKNKTFPPEYLWDTYGISLKLMILSEKGD